MEKTFFEGGNVKITNARFVNGNKTYAISSIVSVSLREKQPNLISVYFLFFLSYYSFLTLIFKFLAGLSLSQELMLGIFFAVCAYFLLKSKRTRFFVTLMTAGGEVDAFESYNSQSAQQIINALDDAIIFR